MKLSKEKSHWIWRGKQFIFLLLHLYFMRRTSLVSHGVSFAYVIVNRKFEQEVAQSQPHRFDQCFHPVVVLALVHRPWNLVSLLFIQLCRRSVIDFGTVKRKWLKGTKQSDSFAFSLFSLLSSCALMIIQFSPFQSCVICRTTFPLLFLILIWCFRCYCVNKIEEQLLVYNQQWRRRRRRRTNPIK